MFINAAYAQQANESASTPPTSVTLGEPLFCIELGLLILVLVIMPGYAACRSCHKNSEALKGLNLPKGSVRAMLALLIVGSFVNVLLFGAPVLGDSFEQVITAFGTLAGAVTGFYFAGRKSGGSEAQQTPASGATSPGTTGSPADPAQG